MIIMNETQLSIVSKLENIAEREEKKADSFLATALRTANEEGRSEILNSEKSEYELLNEKSKLLADVLTEIKSDLQAQ
tara:strand:- start:70 stop:303 length:234 start_codon:yes stop_codon:yes gene_type:complete